MPQMKREVSKRKRHKEMQQAAVNLVSVVNRITDRDERGIRPSSGDIAHAKRLMTFLTDDLNDIVESYHGEPEVR